MTAQYGLIGYPITHSFSPAYFAKKFEWERIDAVYKSFPLTSIDQFPDLLQTNVYLKGLNVTIPYKESVILYLDETDEEAKGVGAVNCISIQNGITKGYNTDVIAFMQSLVPLLKPYHNNALILGTGGAAKAVAYVLAKLEIPFKYVSRNRSGGTMSYDELSEVADHKLIINTTPAGMWPDVETFPLIPYNTIGKQHLLYDLVYNPTLTQFLLKGAERGATVKNGLEMLELQAEASWKIWNTNPQYSIHK